MIINISLKLQQAEGLIDRGWVKCVKKGKKVGTLFQREAKMN